MEDESRATNLDWAGHTAQSSQWHTKKGTDGLSDVLNYIDIVL
jgi:hypothetical protein